MADEINGLTVFELALREHPTASRFARLRRLARWRRRLAPAVLWLPLGFVWAFDLATRGSRIAHFQPLEMVTYLLASVETLVLWGSLVILASRLRGVARLGTVVVGVLLAALLLGGQRYFFQQYFTYLNADAARFGVSVGRSVSNHLAADAWNLARVVILPALVMMLILVAARRLVRSTRTSYRVALVVAPASVAFIAILPCSYRRAQAATPDVILLHAFGRAIASRTGLSSERWVSAKTRHPEFLPALTPRPPHPRNVVFVLTESERADVVCSAYDPGCKTTPFSNAVSPGRIPLLRLRSVDSVTFISLVVLWSGMSAAEPSETLQVSPLLWDYAHAAGFETAYITSQNPDFAEARIFVQDLQLKHRCDASDLEPEFDPDIGAPDELATHEALRDIADLKEPFFAVVHYSNTHFPYRVDALEAPFRPYTDSKDPARNSEFFNLYRNSVYLSDKAVGTLIEGIRALPSGNHTVIVLTSDHAEAFREHYQVGHGESVYDEELRVPGWIDAPAGTLGDEERANLERASHADTWHLDIVPTVLDLIGVWDNPEIARFRSRMLGRSLLRELVPVAVPLTNCSAVWECPFRNWGMMRGRFKLEARQWDSEWHCFDLEADQREQHDLGPRGCGELADLAIKYFHKRPHE